MNSLNCHLLHHLILFSTFTTCMPLVGLPVLPRDTCELVYRLLVTTDETCIDPMPARLCAQGRIKGTASRRSTRIPSCPAYIRLQRYNGNHGRKRLLLGPGPLNAGASFLYRCIWHHISFWFLPSVQSPLSVPHISISGRGDRTSRQRGKYLRRTYPPLAYSGCKAKQIRRFECAVPSRSAETKTCGILL